MASDEHQHVSKNLKRKKDGSEREQRKGGSKKPKKERRREADSARDLEEPNGASDLLQLPQLPQPSAHAGPAIATEVGNRSDASKTKKRKEKKSNAAQPALESNKSEVKCVEPEVDTEGAVIPEAPAADETASPSSNTRFIVFVGNLPYTTTTSALGHHFSSIKPAYIRHRTQKDDPTISRGFAFLEFAQYDRMRTCLKLYHHSMFDDGKTAPRRINVELTAGGGGRGTERKEKLKVKNQRLWEQRKRKKESEDQERGNTKGKKTNKASEKVAVEADAGTDGMHPSRKAMLDGAR